MPRNFKAQMNCTNSKKKKYRLPKMTQEETETLNNTKIIKEFCFNKNLPTRKKIKIDGFINKIFVKSTFKFIQTTPE